LIWFYILVVLDGKQTEPLSGSHEWDNTCALSSLPVSSRLNDHLSSSDSWELP